jgi:hypothetical protein
MKDTGGPAFPTTTANYDNMDPHGEGMTLRDYFAAKAMQGMFAGRHGSVLTPSVWATQAFKIADAMLAERGKT